MAKRGAPGRTTRLAGIDTLRGCAAAAVFLCHIGGYWTFLNLPWKIPAILTWGAHGVDIFIVISGFCLMMPVALSDGRLAVSQFYGRRAWRILPAYWVALAFASMLALLPATTHLVVAAPASISDVLIHVFGMQTWIPGSLGTINGSLWSVSLEIQLYIVFPILIWLYRRRGVGVVVGAALGLAMAWNLLGYAGVPYTGDSHAMPARLIQFTLGMACAVLVVKGRTPRGRYGLLVACLAGGVGAIGYTARWDMVIQDVIWGLCGVGLIVWLNGMGAEGHSSRALEAFGARSYSFYLLHQPALLLCAGVVALIGGGWVVQVAVGGTMVFALTTLAAWVLFRTVEQPSHRLGRRFFPRPTSRSVTAHSTRANI